MVDVGKEVQVEVLDVDLERERVSLSLKATQEDPWRQFARQREIGEIIEGRVTKLVPFGAFVELDDAIEGLVHISELAERHVEKAEDEVRVHDRIPVKIIDIDLDRRRISLSRKQALRATGSGDEVTEPAPEIELEPADAATEAVSEVPGPDAETVPAEEREEAEATRVMASDSPVAAAEGEPESIDSRLSEEEPELDAAPPPTAVDEASEPGVSSSGTEDELSEEGADESLESIVEDLKRRGGR